MNHNIRKILKENNLHLKQIGYKKNSKIVDTQEGKYILKTKKKDKEELYNYLQNRNFNNYLPLKNKYTDYYEMYPFIENKSTQEKDKAIDLIYTISMLHIKTTTYEDKNIDEIKEIYEQTQNEINDIKSYYLNIQDYIETKVYMSPAEYLLMRNISQIYAALNFSTRMLDLWYEEIKEKKSVRKTLLHNNLSLDHFFNEDNFYLVDWDNSKKGYVIYDFLNFYKNEYVNLEMNALFQLYQSKYKYTKDEKLLFLSLIAIPNKVKLNKTNYINTLEVRKLVTYLGKTNYFISKEYKKDQKTDKEELK